MMALDARISEVVANATKALGYSDILDCATKHPLATFEELATKLTSVSTIRLVPMQVDLAFREFCTQSDRFEYYCRSSLLRRFREMMPKGWDTSRRIDPAIGRAIGAWVSRLPEGFLEESQKVINFFGTLEPVQGWLPESEDDRLLKLAFIDVKFPVESGLRPDQ